MLSMKPLHQESLGMFPLSSKIMHDRTSGFFGNSKFSTKTEIMLMFIQKQMSSGNSGDFLER